LVSAPRRKKLRRAEVLRLAAAVVLFCAAPTAGDIGSCNQPEQVLDAHAFFLEKKKIDCVQCLSCGLTTRACDNACSVNASVPSSFPPHCLPLVHDGEVCIDALAVASCSDYASYVADQGSTTPSECDFCPPAGQE
jgi:hypothetical protein